MLKKMRKKLARRLRQDTRAALLAAHESRTPATYFEIGVRGGASLALSKTKAIGVDPDYHLLHEITCQHELFQLTSDAFFADHDLTALFGGKAVDMAYIDGMHRFAFVLRDFINTERHMSPDGVIFCDDVMPRNAVHASLDQVPGKGWTGDVWKIVPVLQRYRPDLTLVVHNTSPCGLLEVQGLDPDSTTLADAYDQIIAEYEPRAFPGTKALRRSYPMAGPPRGLWGLVG